MSTLIEEASSRLAAVAKKAAPKGAQFGAWSQTIEMAAVSTCDGGFRDSDGNLLPHDDWDRIGALYETIGRTVQDLYEASDRSWNVARIAWRSGERLAKIELAFDAAVIPRAPNDPVYEQAAATRRDFWKTMGRLADGYLGPPSRLNAHAQSQWLSPHRRLVLIDVGAYSVLATDGLSTPCPGIPDKVNGSGIELYLELPKTSDKIEPWVDVLLVIGDVAANTPGIEQEVVDNGAILFSNLPDSVAPFSHAILSLPKEPAVIESLPFGSCQLLKVTAVTRDDLGDASLDGWAVEAAHHALKMQESAGP